MPDVQVSAEALERAAVAAFGGRVMVALFSGAVEETDAGYHRRAVTLTGPERDADGARVMVNAEDVVFEPHVRDSERAIDGWALYGDGALLVRGSVSEPRMLQAGDQYVIRAGQIRAGFKS